jgi:membrane-associated phospholipid phosphatase
MELRVIVRLWCVFFVATLLIVGLLIGYVDVPLATFCLRFSHHIEGLGQGLGSPILVAGEITVMAILAIARIARGELSEKSKAVFVAAATSLSAFVANDYVLKMIFGRKNPFHYFHDGVASQFIFFHGDQQSSFPSGHMVLATAFAATLMRVYPRSSPTFVLLLLVGALALVIGNWHFAGDVVAGTFVGATAGFVAGELWIRHNQTRNLRSDQVREAAQASGKQKIAAE